MTVTLWPGDVKKLQHFADRMVTSRRRMAELTPSETQREVYIADAEHWEVVMCQCQRSLDEAEVFA